MRAYKKDDFPNEITLSTVGRFCYMFGSAPMVCL